MINELTDFIDSNHLFIQSDKILVGVSGGVDSVVLLDLLKRLNCSLGIAHCNFQLRGEEANEDESFVKELAESFDIPFYVRRFETKEFASEHKISIQMAARKLRYNWFEEIRKEEGYDLIALGHNKNDAVETFLINLTRGTGIKGLMGIQPKMNCLIRPLLFADRNRIISYSAERGLKFREDSSNKTVKYSRNKIRHHIIPDFQEINPRFLTTMTENMSRLKEVYKLYKKSVEVAKDKLVREAGGDFYILKEGLRNSESKGALLFEILDPFNFNREHFLEIENHLSGKSGKVFYSPTHKLIVDREYLIVTSINHEEEKKYYLDEQVSSIRIPVSLEIRKIEDVDQYSIPVAPDKAAIDYDKLDFPLILRKWQHGDYFKPFGFEHFKKLSDYFTDRKYSLLDKERCWIVASGEQIVWIVNDRLDDRFKVDNNTRTIIELNYSE